MDGDRPCGHVLVEFQGSSCDPGSKQLLLIINGKQLIGEVRVTIPDTGSLTSLVGVCIRTRHVMNPLKLSPTGTNTDNLPDIVKKDGCKLFSDACYIHVQVSNLYRDRPSCLIR